MYCFAIRLSLIPSVILILAEITINAEETGREINYCEISPDHFLCKSYLPGNCDHPVEQIHFNTSLKDQIIELHNRERTNLANEKIMDKDGYSFPCASNLYKLKWNNILEKTALQSASRCNLSEYSESDQRMLKYYYEEEEKLPRYLNLAETLVLHTHESIYPAIDFEHFIAEVLEQRKYYVNDYSGNYVYNPEDRDNSKRNQRNPTKLGKEEDITHFVNLISGDIYLMGCAMSRFISSEKEYTNAYVCHYGPAPMNEGNLYKNKFDDWWEYNSTTGITRIWPNYPYPASAYCSPCWHCNHTNCFKDEKLCNSEFLGTPTLNYRPSENDSLTTPKTTTSSETGNTTETGTGDTTGTGTENTTVATTGTTTRTITDDSNDQLNLATSSLTDSKTIFSLLLVCIIH